MWSNGVECGRPKSAGRPSDRKPSALHAAVGFEFEFGFRVVRSTRKDAGDKVTSWLRVGGGCVIERALDGTTKDIITDAKGSVVATGDAGGLHVRGYAAYGYAPPADSAQCALGYDGEYTDPITGDYHLGNGYRAYSPTLMRFTAPDAWAPFGGGGLNPYAYCAGNPINASDPSGHMPAWLYEASLIAALAATGISFLYNGANFYLLTKELRLYATSGGETLDDAFEMQEMGEISRHRPTGAQMHAPARGRLNLGPRGKALAKTTWYGIATAKDAGGGGITVAAAVAFISQNNAAWRNGTRFSPHGIAQWGTYVGIGVALIDIPASAVSRSLAVVGRPAYAGPAAIDDLGQEAEAMSGLNAEHSPNLSARTSETRSPMASSEAASDQGFPHAPPPSPDRSFSPRASPTTSASRGRWLAPPPSQAALSESSLSSTATMPSRRMIPRWYPQVGERLRLGRSLWTWHGIV
jgi:RHS repeat-associated protein